MAKRSSRKWWLCTLLAFGTESQSQGDKDIILITGVQGLFFLTLGRMVKWVCYYCTPAASLPLTGPPASVTLAAWTAERRWAPAAGIWDPEGESPQLGCIVPFHRLSGHHLSSPHQRRAHRGRRGTSSAILLDCLCDTGSKEDGGSPGTSLPPVFSNCVSMLRTRFTCCSAWWCFLRAGTVPYAWPTVDSVWGLLNKLISEWMADWMNEWVG